METTINTFCKFKEYKEKRVRELIRKYNVFLGIPWGLISVICGICCLLLYRQFALKDKHDSFLSFVFEGSYLSFALIFSLVFAILAIVKYIRSLYVQKVIYDCLYHLSDYERVICSKIEIDTLRKQMQVNNNEIKRLQCLIDNLDLKRKIINITLRINCHKYFLRITFSMNQDEYKKMLKNIMVLLQERNSYRELQNKYNAEKQLLETRNKDLTKRVETIEKNVADDKQKLTNVDKEKTKNKDLTKRVETIEKNVADDKQKSTNVDKEEPKNEDLNKRVAIIEKNVDDDKQMLKNIDEKLKSALESKIFIWGILKDEIRLFFTDLVEVVSQIKIQ